MAVFSAVMQVIIFVLVAVSFVYSRSSYSSYKQIADMLTQRVAALEARVAELERWVK